jgi:hypothetical protein
MSAAKESGLHELDIKGDGDLIADKNAAGFQRGVPSQAEVFAVELGGRRGSQARAAPWILGGRGRSLYRENHMARHVANGQVASDQQFSFVVARDARRLELQHRELLPVKEVLALKMCVTLRLARVDLGRIDRGFDTRVPIPATPGVSTPDS